MSDLYEDLLIHYGVKRRSGRYPWGSGKDKKTGGSNQSRKPQGPYSQSLPNPSHITPSPYLTNFSNSHPYETDLYHPNVTKKEAKPKYDSKDLRTFVQNHPEFAVALKSGNAGTIANAISNAKQLYGEDFLLSNSAVYAEVIKTQMLTMDELKGSYNVFKDLTDYISENPKDAVFDYMTMQTYGEVGKEFDEAIPGGTDVILDLVNDSLKDRDKIAKLDSELKNAPAHAKLGVAISNAVQKAGIKISGIIRNIKVATQLKLSAIKAKQESLESEGKIIKKPGLHSSNKR